MTVRARETPSTEAPSTVAAWAETTHGTVPSPRGAGALSGLTRFGEPDAAPALSTFDVCHPALALRAVLLVQVLLLGVALALAPAWSGVGAQWGALALPGVLGTVAWLLAVCALRRRLEAQASGPRALAVLGLGATAAAGAAAAAQQLGLVEPLPGPRWLALLLAGVGVSGGLWAWLAWRARLWAPAHQAARLAELQSRIRPHFLFNTLNSAIALVTVDPARAEAVLEDLAELFRVALSESGLSVSLAEEIALAQRYLAIEQVRFGNRLQVQWQLEVAAGAARVPPLLLQPLVENAVKHGVEPNAAGGRLLVRTRLRSGLVEVMVRNSVGAASATPGAGMALENVRQRLALLHDVGAACKVSHDAQGFQVELTLPLDAPVLRAA